MNDKDKMYILNDILCEVKPLYLRQRVGARFIEFVDNKIPEGSVVLSKEEYEALTNDLDKGDYGDFENGYSQARKQAVKEFAERLKERLYNFQTWEVPYDEWCKGNVVCGEIDETLKQFGVEL